MYEVSGCAVISVFASKVKRCGLNPCQGGSLIGNLDPPNPNGHLASTVAETDIRTCMCVCARAIAYICYECKLRYIKILIKI